jgi:threonyl-tRNA synthetase
MSLDQSQISLTFPDGASRSFPRGTTPGQVAEAIAKSLAKKAISAQVNGRHWDLQWPIEEDAAIAINTMEDGPRRSNSSATTSPTSWRARCRRSGPT